MALEAIIGLEVHAQMSTKTKMFCGCDNDAFGKEPNTTVCPVCMGHPGSLPVPNGAAVEKALRMSLALGCTVASDSHFDRKHYFYPDLPSGFQISQYDFPLAQHGEVEYDLVDDSGRAAGAKTCRIHRLHMENDAGKLTHRGTTTLCDYNRSGTPLMEIVTEPDLRSAEEAVAFASELRRILITVGASDADMFKGMMRFDASISLREVGTDKLNPRSEIKNLNSFKALEKALQYEEKRLRAEWEKSGGPLKGNITVGWMDEEGKTRMLREKETADDYRYFPEPDLPPLQFDAKKIAAVKKELPTLPRQQRKAYADLGLDQAQAMQLLDDARLRRRFDAVHKATKDGKRSVGLVLTQMVGFLNAASKSLDDAPDETRLVELIALVDDGTISGNAAKEVLQIMIESGKAPKAIIEERGMKQIADTGALENIVKKAIAANPGAVENFKKGKAAALGVIVGWVMKETKGQANPGMVNEIVRKQIG